jgi:hypothetical protein
LARPSISEWVDIWRIEGLLTQTLYRNGCIENNVSTDGQIAINRQIDVCELRVNARTIVCGRSAITNRVRASVWALTHALANVDLAVETLFSITPVSGAAL